MVRLTSFEREMFIELKEIKPKAKWKDVMEWTFGEPNIEEGEELVRLPGLGINLAIKVLSKE